MREKSKNRMLAPTRWRLLEFKDPAIEVEYFDYHLLSNQKALMMYMNLGLFHCTVMAIVFPVLFLAESDRPVLLAFLIFNLIFFGLKAKTRANVKKDVVNQQILLLFSSMILINDFISVSILANSQVWVRTNANGDIRATEQSDLCILWFSTFESVCFYLCTVHFEAKVGMGHTVFHCVAVFTR